MADSCGELIAITWQRVRECVRFLAFYVYPNCVFTQFCQEVAQFKVINCSILDYTSPLWTGNDLLFNVLKPITI